MDSNHNKKTKSAEDRYRLLYMTSQDAIMTLEPPTWKFTQGNPAAIKMFGAKSEKEFISLSPEDASPKKQPDGKTSKTEAKKMIKKALKDGSVSFGWTHRRLNMEDFPALVLLTRVDSPTGQFIQATVRDVTKEEEYKKNYKIK
ncbi:MAG: PAS domain S-box protein [Patescibacteria group bacterium]|nr:PAS domain S-box protein [Patescibacteria group bacterium]